MLTTRQVTSWIFDEIPVFNVGRSSYYRVEFLLSCRCRYVTKMTSADAAGVEMSEVDTKEVTHIKS